VDTVYDYFEKYFEDYEQDLLGRSNAISEGERRPFCPILKERIILSMFLNMYMHWNQFSVLTVSNTIQVIVLVSSILPV
jgi:hypothetical protein